MLSDISGSPPIYTTVINYFRGVDVTSAPINVAPGRAYYAPNMIRDVPGKVRKRMGYELIASYDGQVNGMFSYNGHQVFHVGSKLYSDGTVVKDDLGQNISLPNRRSVAYRIADKLMILTGDGMYAYWENGNTRCVAEVCDIATVPQVTVGRSPSGGGESLGQVNLLTSKYMDSFLGTANDTEYQLSFYPVDTSSVTAKKINAQGEWVDITDTISSVDHGTGVVTFSTAPGSPPVSGEDNVRIWASSYAIVGYGKIKKCRFGIIAGVGAAYDRLFISGNPDLPNTDWFSNSEDPLYFGDWNYGEIGKPDSPITGYSIIDSCLATHKLNDDDGRNIYIREGYIDQDRAIVDLMSVKFPITKVIQGKGCIAPYSMGYLGEPLYLTQEGIFATTPYEFNGRMYAQRRSFFLDGQLLNEVLPENAVSIVWKDFYLLALNGNVYVLDSLQRDTSDAVRGSMYQYEGYIWTGIPVRCWYADENLWFGDAAGNIYRFFSNKYSSISYNDNGASIYAYWEFMHTGSNLYLDKTLMWAAVNLDSTASATLDLYAKKSDEVNWQMLALNANVSCFEYSGLYYSTLGYGGSDSPKTIGKRIKLKRYDSAYISLRNIRKNECVFLYAITLQFAEGEKYKL